MVASIKASLLVVEIAKGCDQQGNRLPYVIMTNTIATNFQIKAFSTLPAGFHDMLQPLFPQCYLESRRDPEIWSVYLQIHQDNDVVQERYIEKAVLTF